MLGFGTLADGFVPFELGPGRGSGEIKMCSVVMKAVQGRADKMGPPGQACAGGAGELLLLLIGQDRCAPVCCCLVSVCCDAHHAHGCT